jgi:carboxyl-terminal processing protease
MISISTSPLTIPSGKWGIMIAEEAVYWSSNRNSYCSMMKFNLRSAGLTLVVGFLLTSFALVNPPTDVPSRESLLMEVVLGNLYHYHYTTVDVNDAFSERVFDTYIDRIDNEKRFFILEDIEHFSTYRLMIDDYAKESSFAFFDTIHEIRTKRIDQIRRLCKKLLKKPFDFSAEESFESNADKMAYVATVKELKERWRKLLKYRVMISLETRLDQQASSIENAEAELVTKSMEELEAEAREAVMKGMDRFFVAIDQQDRDDKIDEYIGVFVNAVEPHTGFYPPLEKENFDIRISGKLEGIGAQLVQKDGYIKVTRIIQGSASWKQGDLEVNDLIIKVAQGSDEAVDIVNMKMNDVLPMIRGEKGTEVRLSVKKPDGTITLITIIRDEVVLEEGYAKSALLSQAGNESKVGLIDLRSFYADFQDPRGRRCSRDIKNEVQKLIDEKVSGIIIDLRYNGGGSLNDVVDMTGLFIEMGPVVQVKRRGEAPTSLGDRDPSVLYDGPLVILVNSFSASSSEILAAALQDYGRAIIVGDAPSTFGKGTVQRFFQLDSYVPLEYKDLGELGSIKSTIQKFFRVNGGSIQLKGVIPDIVLPGVYTYLETGEKEEDFPLEWTEIEPVFYDAQTLNLDEIKAKSAKRVEKNPAFAMIDEEAKWFKSLQDETEISLNLEQYRKDQAARDAKSDEFESSKNDIEGLTISTLAVDEKKLEEGEVRLESINTWHKALKKDVCVMEAMQIIGDW